MFARQPSVDGLGDGGLGQRSRWIAGPTQVTRTSGGCRHSEADDVDDYSSVAGRDLHRASRIPVHVHQRERNCSSTPPHSTVRCQIADVDFDLVLLFTCTEQLHDRRI